MTATASAVAALATSAVQQWQSLHEQQPPTKLSRRQSEHISVVANCSHHKDQQGTLRARGHEHKNLLTRQQMGANQIAYKKNSTCCTLRKPSACTPSLCRVLPATGL
mmetsp:Transcript_83371/g.165494  ORF Transcript_83371/g.165494 Transcript_83371/m.165494 type:complete len:107 (-) Transcript_83371:361-681(-)